MLLHFMVNIVVPMAETEKSHHCCGIPVEFDGVLKHLLVGIEFRAA
jgi:hypothetical protein